jgi:hypothetical protein
VINTVMQRENETRRVVLDGRRTDDGTRCTLVAIRQLDGTWAHYPHGADQLGVRLSKESAVTLAREILAGAE